jgi:hypothetical protein
MNLLTVPRSVLAMRILLVGLEDATPERLLENEDLASLRHLMGLGTYGHLRSAEPTTPCSDLVFVRNLLTAHAREYIQLVGRGVDEGVLDAEVGHLLELLAEDTVVLAMTAPGTEPTDPGSAPPTGAFILAVPQGPALGHVESATVMDLATTLLELIGAERPASLPGRSLLAGQTERRLQGDEELDPDEALVRERLSGLGYIG